MTRQPRCVFIRRTAPETNALRGNQLLLLRKISARRGCRIDLGDRCTNFRVSVLSRPFRVRHTPSSSRILNDREKYFVKTFRRIRPTGTVHTHAQNDIVRYIRGIPIH